MNVHGLSSEECKAELNRLGVSTLTYESIEQIESGDTVVINDKDNTCPQEVINKLADNSVNIVYIYKEANKSILRLLVKRNVYNLYKVESELDIDFLISVLEVNLTLSDIAHLVDKDIEVNNMSELVEVVEEFFTAMDLKNKDELERIYLAHFEDMLKLPEVLREHIAEGNIVDRELRRVEKALVAREKETSSLNERQTI